MKVKLKDKKKPIGYFNSMMGFTPDQRSLLNAGEVVEVEFVREDAELFVTEVKPKIKEEKDGKK